MGSIAVSPSTEFGSFGYDFEDSQTRAQLEFIDDLHKLGVSKYIDLPQLVVVGDQSTGKSSVLQAVTSIPFSIDDKMCTRFATEIVLQRTALNDPTIIDICIVPDADESPDRKRSLLAWRPEDFDPKANLDKFMLRTIFEQAEKVINGDSVKKASMSGRRANRLSNSTLRITRTGPKEQNFSIVDIPGLVRGNESQSEYRTAKKLVQKYLNNSRSIIVVVIDVIDLDRQEIINMLHDLPDEELRLIGVINKCDTKQKKSDDWVFDLIRNDKSQSPKYLKEGWYGLRNRQASELDISDPERDMLEEEFFAGDDWKSLDKSKLGRHHLKTALINMRNQHVKRSIPGVLSEIQEKLEKCIGEIDKLGESRKTNQSQYNLVNRIATRYSMMARGALNGHYEDLSDDKLFARKQIRDVLTAFQRDMVKSALKVPWRSGAADAELIDAPLDANKWGKKLKKTETYAWINAAIDSYRAKEEIGEVNPDVKDYLWKLQTGRWKKISEVALQNTERTIESVNNTLFEKACPDSVLRRQLQTWLQEEFQKASSYAKDELERLLMNEREAHLLTLDPRKEDAKQRYNNGRVEAIAERYKLINPQTATLSAADSAANISTYNIIRAQILADAELVGIFNTHDSLAAYYDIALYRFIDNFALQVVERHLLGPRGPLRLFNSEYVSEKLYGEDNAKELSALASEDPVTAQKRVGLDAERKSLEEGKRRVQNFKLV